MREPPRPKIVDKRPKQQPKQQMMQGVPVGPQSPAVPCPWHMVMKRDHPESAPPCMVRPDNLALRIMNIGQLLVWLAIQATEQAEAYMRIFEAMPPGEDDEAVESD